MTGHANKNIDVFLQLLKFGNALTYINSNATSDFNNVLNARININ